MAKFFKGFEQFLEARKKTNAYTIKSPYPADKKIAMQTIFQATLLMRHQLKRKL